MSSAHKGLLIGAGAALLGLLLFCLGRWTAPAPSDNVKTLVVTDTVTIRETVTKLKPVPSITRVRDSIPVPVPVPVPVHDTITIRDTVYIRLPREVKTYQDDRYYAEISGYQPSLDRIDIFEQTRIITNDKTTTTTRRTRWGLGLQVGAGVTLSQQPEWHPYIGIGISYNILRW